MTVTTLWEIGDAVYHRREADYGTVTNITVTRGQKILDPNLPPGPIPEVEAGVVKISYKVNFAGRVRTAFESELAGSPF